MPTADIGPIGDRVAANVKRLRVVHDLSLRELEAKLRGLGRPILASGIMKLERGQRRIDVDDLVALAAALEVPPERLLKEHDDGRRAIGTATETDTAMPIGAHGGAPIPKPVYPDEVTWTEEASATDTLHVERLVVGGIEIAGVGAVSAAGLVTHGKPTRKDDDGER